MNREELLRVISELDFSALDLQLFLNTHPNEKKAIAQYNLLTAEAVKMRAEYEKHFGPLMSCMSASNDDAFTWINDPWPWERNFIHSDKN